jgi:hypothetical protein
MSKINYGFTTFSTISWLPLVQTLVESVLKFSNHNITVNLINCEYNFNNPRVRTNTINVKRPSFFSICACKWLSVLACDYDVGLILDADMIVTPEIDSIFLENSEKILNSNFPLFAKHPNNVFNDPKHKQSLSALIGHFSDQKPVMKYVYASCLFSKNNLWFIKEVYDTMIDLHKQGLTCYIEDEGLINSLLTKYQVDYDIGYNYLPNTEFSYDYINETIQKSPKFLDTYINKNCPVKFYTFHGCKDKDEIQKIYHLLSNKYETDRPQFMVGKKS